MIGISATVTSVRNCMRKDVLLTGHGGKCWLSCAVNVYKLLIVIFLQAEDGIRDAQVSRGLGDVYKRQAS